MSPVPCWSRHPPLGMKNTTAPGVHAPGHATPLPVDVSTQCPSLARSPRGGVAGGGLALGRPAASGSPSWSGGEGWPAGHPPAKVALLMVTVPPLVKLVTYASPEHEPF